MAIQSMNKNRRQTGKGIFSFIIGLLLATVVIAGILFYLNNKGKADFKTLSPTSASMPATTEIMTPLSTASNPTTSSFPDASPEETTSSMTSSVTETATPEAVEIPQTSPDANEQHQATTVTQPHTNPHLNHTPKEETPKVTPEQILNSGSIEKAQQNNKVSTDKFIVQMGAFSHQTEAEVQRAKLVMLGIESQIHPAHVNGSIKYRVQTSPINRNQANQIRQTLRQNNIDSLTRNAS